MPALVIVPLFVLASVAVEVVAGRRSRSTVSQWATDGGLHLRLVKRLWFSTGTWGVWAGGRSRRYFDVSVEDGAGATRTGTAKVYGGLAGVVADEIEVRWR